MVKELLKKEIRELKTQIADLQKELEKKEGQIDWEDTGDPVCLMSVWAYEKYKDKVLPINCWWWLRDLGVNGERAMTVNGAGMVYRNGTEVNIRDVAVRPMLNVEGLELSSERFYNFREFLVYCGITWKRIKDNLYVAEVPIGFHRFDKKSGEYDKSEIREWLLEWYHNRQGM